MKYIKLFVLFLSLAYGSSSLAQHTAKPQPAVKFKMPVLTISLGKYADTAIVPAAELAGIIGLPLKVTDAKNIVYKISSYQFLYRQLAVTEDDSLTGKPSLTMSQRADLFKTTPLPAAWLDLARENPHASEEYIFFDIIVKDAQGHALYAPNLKLTLK